MTPVASDTNRRCTGNAIVPPLTWTWFYWIKTFPLTLLYNMLSLSPVSDSSLRFLSHCKNGSPLSIISMPRSASVTHVDGEARCCFNDSRNDDVSTLTTRYPSYDSTGHGKKRIPHCRGKLIISCACRLPVLLRWSARLCKLLQCVLIIVGLQQCNKAHRK